MYSTRVSVAAPTENLPHVASKITPLMDPPGANSLCLSSHFSSLPSLPLPSIDRSYNKEEPP